MVTHDEPTSQEQPAEPNWFWRYVFATNHKTIGLQYLWLSLFSVFLAMAMSLLMRIHLIWLRAQIPFLPWFGNTPDRYAALTLLHGSLMVFLVLTTAPQAGFGNYFLPLQIGANEMAFPVLNALSFWLTVLALVGIIGSFFLPPAFGMTLWTAGVAIFCLGALLTAINFSVTTIDLRTKGMSLPRLPVTVWAWFLNAILSMLIFSILLAACVFLLSDRLLDAKFFVPENYVAVPISAIVPGIFPYLWQRLFWFFAQAEVYVAMLPCFGFITHLLATFARRPVWKERAVVLALCAVGLFGFCVWGEHMFASGLNPYSPLVFSVLASSLGLPAMVLILSWFCTLWNARVQHNTATLFALGFISLFLTGGLSGIFLTQHDLSSAIVSDDFITGHFHLVMGVAATFALIAALFFWFPKMFGRRLNETLGKLHFWLTFAGVYCVFIPMHWLGLVTHPVRASLVPGLGAHDTATIFIKSPYHGFITVATLITVAAQILFLINFLWSFFRGASAKENNPWHATTLEWSIVSPPPANDFGSLVPVVYRGAYEFAEVSGELPEGATVELTKDLMPQHVPPNQRAMLTKPPRKQAEAH